MGSHRFTTSVGGQKYWFKLTLDYKERKSFISGIPLNEEIPVTFTNTHIILSNPISLKDGTNENDKVISKIKISKELKSHIKDYFEFLFL